MLKLTPSSNVVNKAMVNSEADGKVGAHSKFNIMS